MLELASSNDPVDTPGDQPARARCAAMRPAAACHDLRRTRRSHPSRRLAPRANRRRGIDPHRIGFARRAVQTRVALKTFETRHRQTLLVVGSRQVRVAGIARTDRSSLGPGPVRSPHVQASLGIDRRRDPRRPAITIGFTSHPRRQVLSPPGHGLQAFPSLCWVRAEGRGLEPPSVQSDRDDATGPVG